MKYLLLIMAATLTFSGCGSVNQISKSMESDFSGGIQRRVTVYSANGQPIKQWEGLINVEESDGAIAQFQVAHKRYFVSGTVVIEEL